MRLFAESSSKSAFASSSSKRSLKRGSTKKNLQTAAGSSNRPYRASLEGRRSAAFSRPHAAHALPQEHDDEKPFVSADPAQDADPVDAKDEQDGARASRVKRLSAMDMDRVSGNFIKEVEQGNKRHQSTIQSLVIQVGGMVCGRFLLLFLCLLRQKGARLMLGVGALCSRDAGICKVDRYLAPVHGLSLEAA